MPDPRFFANQGPFTIGALAERIGASVEGAHNLSAVIVDVATLDAATEKHISFLDNPRYIDNFKRSQAGACIVSPRNASHAPSSMTTLLVDEPYAAYAEIAGIFYPAALRVPGIHRNASVAQSAELGKDVGIGANAVILDGAMIGDGVMIGSNAVIGPGVHIGDGCVIGANVTISHALIGERVIIHPGACIGQDGFGFASTRHGHIKVPQLGRVIIEDEVEIGAGTAIDRGSGPDTFIGRGTKIDNLVQIGHNVKVGRHCIIVSQAGVSGSTRLGDYVVLGGQAGIAGHLEIGAGARVAAQGGVMRDIPANETVGGSPAVSIRDWHKQTIAIAKMARGRQGEEHD